MSDASRVVVEKFLKECGVDSFSEPDLPSHTPESAYDTDSLFTIPAWMTDGIRAEDVTKSMSPLVQKAVFKARVDHGAHRWVSGSFDFPSGSGLSVAVQMNGVNMTIPLREDIWGDLLIQKIHDQGCFVLCKVHSADSAHYSFYSGMSGKCPLSAVNTGERGQDAALDLKITLSGESGEQGRFYNCAESNRQSSRSAAGGDAMPVDYGAGLSQIGLPGKSVSAAL